MSTGTEAGAAEQTAAAAGGTSVPKAATLKELKAAFPAAAAEFYVDCLAGEMSLEAARAAYTAKVEEDLAQAKAENERLQKEAAKPKSYESQKQGGNGKVGVTPVADGGGGQAFEGDAIVAWNQAVDAKFVVTKDRAKAVAAVVREQPELHAAYLAAVNQRKGR